MWQGPERRDPLRPDGRTSGNVDRRGHQDSTEQNEGFKEKVTNFAKRISAWSRKMTADEFKELSEVDAEFSGKRSELSGLIYSSLLQPMGRFEAITIPADMKTLLDLFDSSVDKYLKGVSQFAHIYNISESSILERLQDLEKKLSNWGNED